MPRDAVSRTANVGTVEKNGSTARKHGKIKRENPVKCTGEGKRWKGNIGEGSRETKTGTV